MRRVRLHCLLLLGVADLTMNSSAEDSSDFEELLLDCDEFVVLSSSSSHSSALTVA